MEFVCFHFRTCSGAQWFKDASGALNLSRRFKHPACLWWSHGWGWGCPDGARFLAKQIEDKWRHLTFGGRLCHFSFCGYESHSANNHKCDKLQFNATRTWYIWFAIRRVQYAGHEPLQKTKYFFGNSCWTCTLLLKVISVISFSKRILRTCSLCSDELYSSVSLYCPGEMKSIKYTPKDVKCNWYNIYIYINIINNTFGTPFRLLIWLI